ncbi:MAG: purine-nucleoside phosphorylase [Gracilibacter sp. BRH_c7a]|nr:MAG: purine-nucleoside phosphorylase [Gracilibacter sp. BRH_c7a]
MVSEQELSKKIEEAKTYLSSKIDEIPEFGIILGSGLGKLADMAEDSLVIKYEDIPHFPLSTVAGHSGKLIIGKISSKNVMMLQGRFHYYEGYEMNEVTFPVRVMQVLGIKNLVVTNAAGGVNKEYNAGDLVLIEDHINLMGTNPLRGSNLSDLGPRFPDLSEAYNQEWRDIALNLMPKMNLTPKQGIYAAVSGPSYETPAEIRYLRAIGADLVGMSTAPEVIVANHGGMKVLGISCVTNMAAGVLPEKLSHHEVIATTQKIEQQFVTFVKSLVSVLE